MQYEATSADDYISQLPQERRDPVSKLRETIRAHLPDGFEESISYGMIGYVVPHTRYPDGYHCNPELPLPFMNLASQKNYIAVYHSGIYADPDLNQWFLDRYKALDIGKPDMGKSCIRFRKPEKIPYGLIGELCEKMEVDDWIRMYERAIKNK